MPSELKWEPCSNGFMAVRGHAEDQGVSLCYLVRYNSRAQAWMAEFDGDALDFDVTLPEAMAACVEHEKKTDETP